MHQALGQTHEYQCEQKKLSVLMQATVLQRRETIEHEF